MNFDDDHDDEEQGFESSDELNDRERAEMNDTAHLDTEAEVSCPYCGELISITLDPGGGDDQDYVEDCEVCCRPWRVIVHYDETGTAEVWAEANQ